MLIFNTLRNIADEFIAFLCPERAKHSNTGHRLVKIK